MSHEIIALCNIFYLLLCRELANSCRFRPRSPSWDSPYTKTFLLFQAHFSRLSLPNSDYLTDTKSALDNATRVMQVSEPFWSDYTFTVEPAYNESAWGKKIGSLLYHSEIIFF